MPQHNILLQQQLETITKNYQHLSGAPRVPGPQVPAKQREFYKGTPRTFEIKDSMGVHRKSKPLICSDHVRGIYLHLQRRNLDLFWSIPTCD